MADHNILGKKGEKTARSFLETNGYIIKEENWKSGKLEIDLIAVKDKTIIFVEVKTRKDKISDVHELISPAKERHLRDAANNYMEEQSEDLECRIDLILIHSKSTSSEVIHIENAITQAE